jgi:hypothetical protein
MTSTRRSISLPGSPNRVNGGSLTSLANVDPDLAKTVNAIEASFLLDPSFFSMRAIPLIIETAKVFRRELLVNSGDPTALPKFFDTHFAHANDIKTSLENNDPKASASILKNSLFALPVVKQSASVNLKLLEAFNAATGSGNRAHPALKTVSRFASQFTGHSFDLRQLILKFDQNLSEEQSLEVLPPSKEVHFLQAAILLALVLLSTSINETLPDPVTPLPQSDGDDSHQLIEEMRKVFSSTSVSKKRRQRKQTLSASVLSDSGPSYDTDNDLHNTRADSRSPKQTTASGKRAAVPAASADPRIVLSPARAKKGRDKRDTVTESFTDESLLSYYDTAEEDSHDSTAKRRNARDPNSRRKPTARKASRTRSSSPKRSGGRRVLPTDPHNKHTPTSRRKVLVSLAPPSGSSTSSDGYGSEDKERTISDESEQEEGDRREVRYMKTIRNRNDAHREEAWRAFSDKPPASSGKPSTSFTFSSGAMEYYGTYEDARNLVLSMPAQENQPRNFIVTEVMTVAIVHTYNTLCETRRRGGVPSPYEVLSLIYYKSANCKAGLVLIDINGIPFHFYRSAKKSDTSCLPSVAQVFNPSAIAELECLGETLMARYIFPVTPDHWKSFMRSTSIKAVPEPVSFQRYTDASSGEQRVRMIEAYTIRFKQLMVGILGPSWKENKYHISIWALMVIFHLGRWMHATLLGRLDLLLDNFEREWEAHYANNIRSVNGLADLFPLALELLDYKCPKGHRGYCEQFCDVCDRSTGSSSTSHDSTEDSSDSNHKKTIDAWHRGFNAWSAEAKKKGLTDVSHKAYEKENPYPKQAASHNQKRSSKLNRRSFAHQQNKVIPHIIHELFE